MNKHKNLCDEIYDNFSLFKETLRHNFTIASSVECSKIRQIFYYSVQSVSHLVSTEGIFSASRHLEAACVVFPTALRRFVAACVGIFYGVATFYSRVCGYFYSSKCPNE